MSQKETTPNPSTGTAVDPMDQIADLLDGSDEQPETKATEAKSTADNEDLNEAPDESTSEDETEVDDAEVEDESVDDDPDEKDEKDDDDDDDRNLSQLLGLGEDQVTVDEGTGDISIKVKVDGEESSVSLKKVLAGYQTDKYNTQKSIALSDQRKTFEEQVQIKAQELQQGLDYNAALLQRLQDELMGEFQRTNWEELRATDPAEYAARQQDQSVRYNQLQAVQNEVQQHYTKAQGEQQQQQERARSGHVQQQYAVMVANNPSWHDKNVMKAEVGKIRSFLQDTYGFKDDAISGIVDASVVAIVQDAMEFRKAKPPAKPIPKNVPKMQKSKGVKRKRVSKLDKLTKAAKQATGSNRRDLEVEAIAELLGG